MVTAMEWRDEGVLLSMRAHGEGSAIVGHHDRVGLKPTRHMTSWNSSHGSRGCSPDALKASGGAGFFYCFAAGK